jgi:hypothetical protein
LAGTLPNMTGVKFCHVSDWLRDSRRQSTNATQASGGQS